MAENGQGEAAVRAEARWSGGTAIEAEVWRVVGSAIEILRGQVRALTERVAELEGKGAGHGA